MHQKLILKVFEKAQKEIDREEPYAAANTLVSYLDLTTGETCSPRSLVTKYSKAKKGESVRLKDYLVAPLCQYIGYESFQDFEKDHPRTKTTASHLVLLWRRCWFKFLLYHLLLLIIALGVYFYIKRERWMVWEENQYIEVKFDTDTYGTRLKFYNERRIQYFKRITPECDFAFFDPDGSPRVWYGKNKDGELQYFSDVGLHPETGKTLKPITDYMIKKYLCDNN